MTVIVAETSPLADAVSLIKDEAQYLVGDSFLPKKIFNVFISH